MVALLGIPGSGKSVVARRLTEAHGFARLRFGDPQRDMLAAGFGLTEDDIDGSGRQTNRACFGGHSVQSLQQTLSHDWGRGGIHSDIWANEWDRRLALLSPGSFVLTDDLQRPNEAAKVRDRGGLIVRITRPGYDAADKGAAQRQARIPHDVELVNEGPAALAALTDEFAARLKAAIAAGVGQ